MTPINFYKRLKNLKVRAYEWKDGTLSVSFVRTKDAGENPIESLDTHHNVVRKYVTATKNKVVYNGIKLSVRGAQLMFDAVVGFLITKGVNPYTIVERVFKIDLHLEQRENPTGDHSGE